MVRFLHTADWQLGMRRHFLEAEALPRFVQGRIDAVARLAELARDQACQFAVVAGDVFESNQVEGRTVGRALDAMAGFSCPVYLLPANHDPLDAGSVYRTAAFRRGRPNHVHVLEDGRPVEVAPGVELVGAPWSSKRPRRDLAAAALDGLDASPNLRILLAHGNVFESYGTTPNPDLIALDGLTRAVEQNVVSYVALGDRHSATEIAPRIWYSGAPEATDFREADAGGALVVDLTREACEVVRHDIGIWRFAEHEAALHHDDDVAALDAWIEALPGKTTTALRLKLAGALSVRAHAALEAALDRHRERLAALQERTDDLALLPDEWSDWKLAGFMRAGADELAGLAERADGHAARDALALLYRLQEQGRLEEPTARGLGA
ncbi:MAG: DNA repair exonuclease [Planctomycetota bacterium]|nr:DNA repair exonuclease [Planctomycetota bacterium]